MFILGRTLFRLGPKGLWTTIHESCFPSRGGSGFSDQRQANDRTHASSSAETPRHTASVDIIVCVHNALTDSSACLASVQRHTTAPYKLILVDDGSDEPTARFLSAFSGRHQATLLRNDMAKGYTRAANQGLRTSTAEYVVLLNSDTVVSQGWIDRMIHCARSDETIGIVGPLSNTASWQSIPDYESDGDWADNPLPNGVDIDAMANWVGRHSKYLYPRMPFLNGFCLLLRRSVIETIGYFDEENFPYGYGEENDFCLRARAAGFFLALADDTYVFHAQSRSYSHERRKKLSEAGGISLQRLHGQAIIDEGVRYCRSSPVLDGIRARARHMPEREAAIAELRRFAGKRVLFVLPADEVGGGSNVVLFEAKAMQAAGIQVGILNLKRNLVRFENRYSDCGIPLYYTPSLRNFHAIADDFDALVATANQSVAPLAAFIPTNKILGYYVQDYEPFFFPDGSKERDIAFKSYTDVPGIRLFTKTEWTRRTVLSNTGKDAVVVGPSVNVDLFYPRPRKRGPGRGVRVCAMIRPESLYRNPLLTMKVLGNVFRLLPEGEVAISIFGTRPDNSAYLSLPRDFPHDCLGILPPREMADTLSECDIFADFSSYQAMGLTALEAMACGAAGLVPKRGGTDSYARHELNALVVDSSSEEECTASLLRLVRDRKLRGQLQYHGLVTAAGLFPERAAANILNTLFLAPSASS
ncbi:MAG: glycosyltransferase [Rhodocyclaceae bacterium]|nr:glycosyltransferase [Rhodocyclaceae bacterium]